MQTVDKDAIWSEFNNTKLREIEKENGYFKMFLEKKGYQ